MAGKLTHRVLHDCKESFDGGSGRYGEADDCLQGKHLLICDPENISSCLQLQGKYLLKQVLSQVRSRAVCDHETISSCLQPQGKHLLIKEQLLIMTLFHHACNYMVNHVIQEQFVIMKMFHHGFNYKLNHIMQE